MHSGRKAQHPVRVGLKGGKGKCGRRAQQGTITLAPLRDQTTPLFVLQTTKPRRLFGGTDISNQYSSVRREHGQRSPLFVLQTTEDPLTRSASPTTGT